METFGAKIRKIREQNKQSMRALAKKLGVSVVYISDIELGHRNPPQGAKLNAIADFLNINREEVKEWALKTRKRVELDLRDGNGLIDTAALTLARRWDNITEAEASAIIKILNKELSNERS